MTAGRKRVLDVVARDHVVADRFADEVIKSALALEKKGRRHMERRAALGIDG